MQLSVKGKQIDVGDALRTHVEKQLRDSVKKYFENTIDAHVTFSREGHLFRADITVHAGRGLTLQANAVANEPYPAFDLAAERIARRLRRYKKKIVHLHHENGRQDEHVVASAFVLNGQEHDREEESNDNPVVVAEMTTPIESLTVSEAVMRMDLGDSPAIMFRNRSHGGLNMIYRRPDGHIGWVDPAEAAALHAKAKA
jgi:ribosomal subunit interface protein